MPLQFQSISVKNLFPFSIKGANYSKADTKLIHQSLELMDRLYP